VDNVRTTHTGRREGAAQEQWYFLPGSFDGLPWLYAEEISVIEQLLSTNTLPDDQFAWYFYKYQLNHKLLYTATRAGWETVHIQGRGFADFVLKLLTYYRRLRVKAGEPAEPSKKIPPLDREDGSENDS
jgi:intein/homing endonuclease